MIINSLHSWFYYKYFSMHQSCDSENLISLNDVLFKKLSSNGVRKIGSKIIIILIHYFIFIFFIYYKNISHLQYCTLYLH